MRKVSWASALLLLAGVFASSAHAASWCVRNDTELQQALTAAAASPGDDEIKLHEGIYTTFNGTFTYAAQTTGWLGITGGWYTVDGNDCAQMRMDASRTILEGAGQHRVLQIVYLPPGGNTQNASFALVNFSVRNGYGNPANFERGGGIGMSSYSDAYTEFRLENLIVANNDGYFGGGAGLILTALYGLLAKIGPRELFAIRTLMLAVANLAAAVVFIAFAMVWWWFCLPMLVGSIAGGWLGAMLGRRMSHRAVRIWTLLVTGATTAVFFVRAYGA